MPQQKEPKIGDRVLFFPRECVQTLHLGSMGAQMPMAATVAWVFSPNQVNLNITDHMGAVRAVQRCRLLDVGEDRPQRGMIAMWPEDIHKPAVAVEKPTPAPTVDETPEPGTHVDETRAPCGPAASTVLTPAKGGRS